MTQGRPPLTALDDILTQTRHLLLSFNGPVCPLFADTPNASIAERLRAMLIHANGSLPAEIEKTENWQKILTYAATISPHLAESIESELTKLESASAATARPTLHLHEMITACRESGRSIAIISSTSATVIRSYLTEHSLENAISVVIARTATALATPTSTQIEQAARELNTVPAACALLTAVTADIKAARHAGARSIGYARTSDSQNDLMNAEADSIIATLTDLALKLRARRPSM